MPFARTTRLYILLSLTITFFFLELIVGYMVGSIALVADSFHMLSDILSLVVALYAIKLAARTNHGPKYSYGWQRAEVLGALVNSVFLLALCFTIYIEAIQRFFEPQEITNPILVLVVGSAGLAVNLIGIFLFHEHGHAHGHQHGRSPQEPMTLSTPSALEGGRRRSASAISSSSSSSSSVSSTTRPQTTTISHDHQRARGHARSRSGSGGMLGDLTTEDVCGHPAQTATMIIQEEEEEHQRSRNGPTILSSSASSTTVSSTSDSQAHPSHPRTQATATASSSSNDHQDHHHHSHGREKKGMLNMHGVFLHVLGDALGSVAVIVSALIIWLGTFSWRFYMDPIISILITTMIVTMTIPLVRSASLILLQGVPSGIPIDEVREEILALDGILAIHELHIWQLSDTKLVASVHILLSQASSSHVMHVQSQVKAVLHTYGIHSTTVQPEVSHGRILLASSSASPSATALLSSPSGARVPNDMDAELVTDQSCLLRCADACDEAGCCPSSPILDGREG
ncbi:MAG: zinc/cadmium resistance protein [Piptocephalis tieghemiana]|nr:MAG: zinc/cadmium resistance protein [Piptocephalis tieghemiana]